LSVFDSNGNLDNMDGYVVALLDNKVTSENLLTHIVAAENVKDRKLFT